MISRSIRHSASGITCHGAPWLVQVVERSGYMRVSLGGQRQWRTSLVVERDGDTISYPVPPADLDCAMIIARREASSCRMTIRELDAEVSP